MSFIHCLLFFTIIWFCLVQHVSSYSSTKKTSSVTVMPEKSSKTQTPSPSGSPTHRGRGEKSLKDTSRAFRILKPFSLIDEVRSFPRKLKVLTSSSLEGLLLRMTMPSDNLVDSSDFEFEQFLNVIEQICLQFDSENNKACNKDEKDSEVCYDLIIRKLSGKLKENDWRIGAKSLHIIHELICNLSISASHRNRFCASYLEKYDSIVDNLSNNRHNILRRNSAYTAANDGLGLPKASEGEDFDNLVEQDDNSRRWMVLKLYAEYLQNFTEVIRRCEGGGSYMNDLVMIKGPAPVLSLFSQYFSSALRLLDFKNSLPDISKIGSFSNTISNCNMVLVNKDIAYAIAQLQAYSSTTVTSSSYHISSFIEMQHISSEIQQTISDINTLVSNSATNGNTNANLEEVKDATIPTAPFAIPMWLGDLTTMESYPKPNLLHHSQI